MPGRSCADPNAGFQSLPSTQIRTVSPHVAVRNVSSIELFSVCYFIPLSCRWLNGMNVYSKRDFSLRDPPLFSFQTDVHGKLVFRNPDSFFVPILSEKCMLSTRNVLLYTVCPRINALINTNRENILFIWSIPYFSLNYTMCPKSNFSN